MFSGRGVQIRVGSLMGGPASIRSRVRAALGSSMSGSLVASGVAQFALIFSGVLVARSLGPEDRGYLAFLVVVAGVLSLIGSMGLPSAATYFIARESRHARQIVSTLARPGVILAGGTLGVQIAVLAALETNAPERVRVAALVSLLLVPGILAVWYGTAILQGQHRFAAFNVLRTVPTASYAIAVLLAYLFHAADLVHIMAIWSLANFLGGFLALGVALRGLPSADAVETLPSRTEMTTFGLKGLVGSTSPVDALRLDQAVVGLFLTPVALGLYVVAQAFTSLPRVAATSVGLIAYPRVAARSDPGAARRAMWSYFFFGVALSLIVVVLLQLVIGVLVPFFFGSDFRDAIPIARILIVGALFMAARRVLTDGVNGLGHPGLGTLAEVASWVVLLPTLVLLLPHYGVEGVALALTIAWGASLLLLLAMVMAIGTSFSAATSARWSWLVARVTRSARTLASRSAALARAFATFTAVLAVNSWTRSSTALHAGWSWLVARVTRSARTLASRSAALARAFATFTAVLAVNSWTRSSTALHAGWSWLVARVTRSARTLASRSAALARAFATFTAVLAVNSWTRSSTALHAGWSWLVARVTRSARTLASRSAALARAFATFTAVLAVNSWTRSSTALHAGWSWLVARVTRSARTLASRSAALARAFATFTAVLAVNSWTRSSTALHAGWSWLVARVTRSAQMSGHEIALLVGVAIVTGTAGIAVAGLAPHAVVVLIVALLAVGFFALGRSVLGGVQPVAATSSTQPDVGSDAVADEFSPPEASEFRLPRLLFYGGLLLLGMPLLRAAGQVTLSDVLFLFSFLLACAELVVIRRQVPIRLPILLLVGMGLFAVGGLLSSFEAYSAFKSVGVVARLLFLTVFWFWLGSLLLSRASHIRTAVSLWVVTAAASGGGAVLQILAGDVIPGTDVIWGRSTGFTGHPNDLGGLTSIAFIPSLMLVTRPDLHLRRRAVSYVLFLLVAAGLILSGSVGALIAAGAATFVWFVLQRSSIRSVVAFAAVGACVAVMVTVQTVRGAATPLERLARVTESSGNQSAGEGPCSHA